MEQKGATPTEAPAQPQSPGKPDRRGGGLLSRLPFRPSEDGPSGSFDLLVRDLRARNSKLDLKDLHRAFAFAETSHRGQKRLSGEDFIEHPVAVAAILADLGMDPVTLQAALLHDVGMSIHRTDHEAYSLFLAEPKLRQLLEWVYDEPERTVVVSEALQAIIGHRRRGEPYTLEAGVVRVADALDMAQGRSRVPVESGRIGIHALSAAAIDEVVIEAGTDRAVKVEIKMNNSAGIFQADDLLATKLRGTPLESHLEVVATIEGETEKRLLREFRLG